ncbi:MAG TPA: tetraacyldisaccharide 4'-kinase [Candidatus Eisenbacteria bacterium]|jgi:tetraacyldisaccharide 4'-kinase
MAGALTAAVRAAGAWGFAAAWEARRRCYAAGWLAPDRVPARVVSIGNLTVGGTGKTTLVLHLARLALTRGLAAAVACRDYRPGPSGVGDETMLFRRSLGESAVFSGSNKRELAQAAAGRGFGLVLVDDGFSHWRLERDVDLVILDARDPWGGGRLFPQGRLREPRRALQRADVVVISRLGPDEDPAPLLVEAGRYAPAALWAAARHRPSGLATLEGTPLSDLTRVRVVSGTGHPAAVAATAREAGLEVVETAAYRDHHWFTAEQARRELTRARASGSTVLITAKDAMRWPLTERRAEVAVLEVEWQWVQGGPEVESRVFGPAPAHEGPPSLESPHDAA